MSPSPSLRARWRAVLPVAVVFLVAPVVAGAQQTGAVPAAPADDARPTVAVLYFTNSALTANADYAPLSKGMAEMLITELARNPAVRVVERDRLQQLLEEQNLSTSGRVDQETAVRVGKTLGAHHLLMGAFVIDPRQNVRIDVRSVNTETSQVEYVESVTGKSDNLLGMVAQLGEKVNAGLKLPPMPMRVRAVGDASSAPPKSGPQQFRAMMLMSRALERQDKGDAQGAIALYKNALEADPTFERAKVRLAMLEQRPATGSVAPQR